MSQLEETSQLVAGAEESIADPSAGSSAFPTASQAAPLLMGVKLSVRVLLGRTELSLKEITQLANGSVVELDCSPNDPVQILVNDRVIAQGEVIVVGGNYGVRITKIATPEERPESSTGNADLLNFSEKLR